MKVIIISAVWCPSCLIMRPRFESVKKEYFNIEFKSYDIDLDEEPEIYNVGNILPVFILINDDNVELGRLIGEQKKEELIKMLENHS
ncbi:MAG: thioredoxin family protein [Tissierellia bacterium]|nr:thioredoxin family protein [Tissierellia bacterium]